MEARVGGLGERGRGQGSRGPEWGGAGGVGTGGQSEGMRGGHREYPSHYLVSHPINESPKCNFSFLDIHSFRAESL